MGAVFLLTVRQLTGKWRLLIMAVLAALPVLVLTIMLGSRNAPSIHEFEVGVLGGMLAGAIIPLVVLAIGTVVFGNEIEDRTLANLTLSPLPRWQIIVPKLLGAIAVAAPFVAVSALVMAYAAYLGDPRAMLAVTAAALVAVALYASLFVWLGLASPQAIGAGLLYIVLWEGLLSRFVEGARLLSIRHYATSLVQVIDPRRLASVDMLSPWAAIGLTALVFGGFLLLTVRCLRRMDVP